MTIDAFLRQKKKIKKSEHLSLAALASSKQGAASSWVGAINVVHKLQMSLALEQM